MSFIRALFKLIWQRIMKIKETIEFSKYNAFTIAEYFRKQGAQIGDDCSILVNRLGNEPYLVKLGNHVTIASGVKFLTHDGGAWLFRKEFPDIQVFGPIIIEDNCVIGENVVLLPNIRIGKNSIVGTCSVVISDIPPNSIAMGVPARVLVSLEKYKEKCIERWEKQRPPDCIIENGKNWWTSKYLKDNREKLKKHLMNLFWSEKKSEDR